MKIPSTSPSPSTNPPSRRPFQIALPVLAALLLASGAERASAVIYYWDANDATAGFGTAQGTWAAPTTNDATQGWSTNSAGTSAMAGTTTTTTSDSLNFGTSTAGLASGTITVSGSVSSGAITFGSASGNITLSGGSITLGGNITGSAASTATNTITSDIVLTGNRQIGTHQQQNNFIFTGVISGTAGLAYSSSSGGTLVLSGMNTFTGNFDHQRGQVSFNSIANAGQNSALGAGSTITLGLNGAQPTIFWYTGTNSASSDRTWSDGGANAITYVSQDGSLQLTGNINFTTTSSVAITLTGTADTGTNEISGNISDAAGAGITSVAVNTTAPTGGSGEAGSWILSGSNSYVGTTTVAGSSILRIANADALGTTAAGTTVQNGGVLELAGGISVGAEALSLQGTGISLGGALRNISGDNSYGGAITLAGGTRINSDAGTLTLSNITNSQNLTIDGAGNTTVSGNITTGTGTLTKVGAGTLTLSGANTYTGATVVSEGSMIVNGSTAAGSSFTVDDGATLGGSGTINGAATVNGNLQPGNSPGILSFSNNLTLGSTANTTMEINGSSTRGTDFDGINVTSALTYDGTLTLAVGTTFGAGSYTFNLLDFGSQSGSFDAITLSGNYTGSLTNSTGDVWGLTSGNETWTFTHSTGDLGLNVVPEPSTWALLAFGAGVGALAIRRRGRRA